MKYYMATLVYPNLKSTYPQVIAAEDIRGAVNEFCRYYELSDECNGAMQKEIPPFGVNLDFFKGHLNNTEEVILSIHPIDYVGLIGG